MQRSISVSVLTPTWNRAEYLERVWRALSGQTWGGFEWIVADDGSTDQTAQVVRDLAAKSDFPVVLIQASGHVGKIRMDNEAVARSRGKFIVWCDSDDYLLPHAIERLLETWNSIPDDRRDSFVGVTALCSDGRATIVDPFPKVAFKDVSWNDLAAVHGVASDMLFFTRSSALKANPFPEVDLVIPESVVWTAIGGKLARLVPEVLMVKEYQAAHGISFSGRMAYNRGGAYALASIVRNLSSYPVQGRARWWRMITFIRYCIHGELRLSEARRLWGTNSSALAFWMAFPIAILLAYKDMLQGKVQKTHREFLAARDHAAISVEELGDA